MPLVSEVTTKSFGRSLTAAKTTAPLSDAVTGTRCFVRLDARTMAQYNPEGAAAMSNTSWNVGLYAVRQQKEAEIRILDERFQIASATQAMAAPA